MESPKFLPHRKPDICQPFVMYSWSCLWTNRVHRSETLTQSTNPQMRKPRQRMIVVWTGGPIPAYFRSNKGGHILSNKIRSFIPSHLEGKIIHKLDFAVNVRTHDQIRYCGNQFVVEFFAFAQRPFRLDTIRTARSRFQGRPWDGINFLNLKLGARESE